VSGDEAVEMAIGNRPKGRNGWMDRQNEAEIHKAPCWGESNKGTGHRGVDGEEPRVREDEMDKASCWG